MATEKVQCPRCEGRGEIALAGKAASCYACGSTGEVDPKDVAWMSQWREKTVSPGPIREEKSKSGRTASTVARPSARIARPTKLTPPPAPSDGKSELHQDASAGYAGRVKVLLEQGADPNARDIEGRTPLHWPAFRGYTEIVTDLLAHGADPTVADNKGRTPLDMATVGKHEAIIAALQEAVTKR